MVGVRLFIILTVALISHSQDPCSPCHCINQVIACKNTSLTSIPTSTFSRLPNPSSYTTLDLSENKITAVPHNAFANLAVSTLNLDNNDLISIDLNAFLNIKANLTTLQIAGNKLNTVPTALGNLDILKVLDIRNNPISATEFDDKTFQSLGDTLTELHFGSPSIVQWPVALAHFAKLQILDFDGSSLQWLPFTAFHGYEYTLKNLTIRNTKLFQIPQAISTLRNLDTLHFDNNVQVGDTGILASAFTDPADASRNSRIKHLTLKNDGLTTMPAVLRKLTMLESLGLDNNQMWYISDNAVDNIQSRHLTSLSLRNCNLDRIPHSLLKLRSLQFINLEANGIHSIEVDDINQHSGLVTLDVSANPIEYISEHAFNNMNNLTSISFANSNVKHIPHAIVNIKDSLKLVDLRNCDVECTCDLQWFLGKLDLNRTQILGDCETIERAVSDYLIHRVPRCPT